MINPLMLYSGNDIPFIGARVSIHQPTIKEIAYIGEDNFFIGCSMLNISKKVLNIEGKKGSEEQSDFDILMSIINNAVEPSIKRSKNCLIMVLTLLFPNYEIHINQDCIFLKQEEQGVFINRENFSEFQKIVTSIFQLKGKEKNQFDYDPANTAARKIAEKLKRGRQIAAQNKQQNTSNESIFNKYISILSVGLQKDCNDLFQYTVFQLYEEFQRFQAKENYDMYIKLKIAGAKDVQDVDNWMDNFHS